MQQGRPRNRTARSNSSIHVRTGERKRMGDSIFQHLQPQTLKLCPQPHSDFLLGLLNTNLS